jgi:hypothetical protein
MDGRTQLPVIDYLQKRFNIEYVDMITEAGPNLILAKQTAQPAIESILKRLKISIEFHCSVGIAVVGHHDCAGNPAPMLEQIAHLRDAIQLIIPYAQNLPVIGLWVNEQWGVQEVA